MHKRFVGSLAAVLVASSDAQFFGFGSPAPPPAQANNNFGFGAPAVNGGQQNTNNLFAQGQSAMNNMFNPQAANGGASTPAASDANGMVSKMCKMMPNPLCPKPTNAACASNEQACCKGSFCTPFGVMSCGANRGGTNCAGFGLTSWGICQCKEGYCNGDGTCQTVGGAIGSALGSAAGNFGSSQISSLGKSFGFGRLDEQVVPGQTGGLALEGAPPPLSPIGLLAVVASAATAVTMLSLRLVRRFSSAGRARDTALLEDSDEGEAGFE